MTLFEHIKASLMSLKSNKFRTFLTMLGIIIGVMSIVTLLSLGKGIQGSIESSFDAFGANTIYARIGGIDEGFGSGPPGTNGGFGIDEFEKMLDYPKKYIDGIATFSQSPYKIQTPYKEKTYMTVGYYGDFEGVFDLGVSRGKMFSESDASSGARVAVIGPDLVESLFNNNNPLGEEISINGVVFKVIGIMKEKGGSSLDNPDEYVTIPYKTFKKYLINVDEFSIISLKAKNANLIEEAKTEAEKIIRKARNLGTNQKDDFTVIDAGELLSTINQVTGFFTVFLAAIAAISLIVGGIGVMNIMFVSITERTKEIGLRKSLGAKNKDILMQFLIESTAVTILGGIIGIILGLTLTNIFAGLLGLEQGLYPDAILLGLVFSLVIGAIFGIYPALKASKLSPIDALRYE